MEIIETTMTAKQKQLNKSKPKTVDSVTEQR